MDSVKHRGFPFSFDPSACRDCAGHCCRGRSGNIWVTVGEIEQIAVFLQMNRIDVISTYLNPVGNRLSIKERYAAGQYECVFFDGEVQQCSIYTARPSQCRLFPFWQHYLSHLEELVGECPGVQLNR